MPETLKTTEAQRKAVYNYDDKFERVNCRQNQSTEIQRKRFYKISSCGKIRQGRKNFEIRHKKVFTYKAQNDIIILSKGNRQKPERKVKDARHERKRDETSST